MRCRNDVGILRLSAVFAALVAHPCALSGRPEPRRPCRQGIEKRAPAWTPRMSAMSAMSGVAVGRSEGNAGRSVASFAARRRPPPSCPGRP